MESSSSNSSPPTVIKTSPEELEFRKQQLEITESKRKIHLRSKFMCTNTKCKISLENDITNFKEIFVHPMLGVLLCKTCFVKSDFRSEGNFKCRWCSNGRKLYSCKNNDCAQVFCSNCIETYLGRKVLNDVKRDEPWICYVCDSKPIWAVRYICDVAKTLTESENSPAINQPDGKTAQNRTDSSSNSTKNEEETHCAEGVIGEEECSSQKREPERRNETKVPTRNERILNNCSVIYYVCNECECYYPGEEKFISHSDQCTVYLQAIKEEKCSSQKSKRVPEHRIHYECRKCCIIFNGKEQFLYHQDADCELYAIKEEKCSSQKSKRVPEHRINYQCRKCCNIFNGEEQFLYHLDADCELYVSSCRSE